MPAISVRTGQRIDSGDTAVIRYGGRDHIIESTPEGFRHLNPIRKDGRRLPPKSYVGGSCTEPGLALREDLIIAVGRTERR